MVTLEDVRHLGKPVQDRTLVDGIFYIKEIAEIGITYVPNPPKPDEKIECQRRLCYVLGRIEEENENYLFFDNSPRDVFKGKPEIAKICLEPTNIREIAHYNKLCDFDTEPKEE